MRGDKEIRLGLVLPAFVLSPLFRQAAGNKRYVGALLHMGVTFSSVEQATPIRSTAV